MKKNIILSIVLLLMLNTSILAGEDTARVVEPTTAETISDSVVTPEEATAIDQILVSYLHLNRRCATCEKLEAYSGEAISSGFSELLKDSSIVWRTVNFEVEGNERYAKEYGLYTQSLIVSRVREGQELKWKNLDQIWLLVDNKENFIAYIQSEVKEFMKPAEAE